MKKTLLAAGAFACGLLAAAGALAQGKEIKIGVIYDLSGPLAAGGSIASIVSSCSAWF